MNLEEIVLKGGHKRRVILSQSLLEAGKKAWESYRLEAGSFLDGTPLPTWEEIHSHPEKYADLMLCAIGHA